MENAVPHKAKLPSPLSATRSEWGFLRLSHQKTIAPRRAIATALEDRFNASSYIVVSKAIVEEVERLVSQVVIVWVFHNQVAIARAWKWNG